MEFVEFVLKGIVTGFILSVMIGPIFFVLLETSITKGVKSALILDAGVLFSDILYILIAYVFYAEVSDLSTGSSANLLNILGGIVFIAYGIYSIFKKVSTWSTNSQTNYIPQTREYIELFVKGFVLNLANPMVIFYWFSIMTLASSYAQKGDEGHSIGLFLCIILSTFFSVDILKIIGAKYLRPLVTKKVLLGLNKLIGIVFIVFGLFLFFKLIQSNI
ncbi:MAG: LysE family transporter [Crocinitomicaceae bacterium]|nr:LysE family transporter [Crocinitomicaceae bacterium]